MSVAVTGIGIHLQNDERIYVEFEQVDFSYSRHQQGRAAGSNPFARSNPTNDSLTPPFCNSFAADADFQSSC